VPQAAESGAVKQEKVDDNPRPRKAARPAPGNIQLELDGDGSFHEGATRVGRDHPDIIELD